MLTKIFEFWHDSSPSKRSLSWNINFTDEPIIPIDGEGVVDCVIYPYQKGRIYFRGSWWPARCEEEVKLLTGQRVKVIGRQNITLIVQPIASKLETI